MGGPPPRFGRRASGWPFHTNVCSCRTGGVSYVELHAHSAYSFLDGASQPEELAARAAELGYPALALTDHDGVYGSLEFAHAAKHFGVRAITGAEVTLDGRCARHAARRDVAGLREPLPAAHARARGHAAEGATASRCRRASTSALLEELHEGLVCLSGCARDGLAVRDPNAAARLAHAFGRDSFFVELQRPYERGDTKRNAALRDLAETLARADDRDRRRARARRAPRDAPGRARRRPLPHVARRLRARAARQPRVRACRTRRHARALPRRPRRSRAHGRARRPAAVRPDGGARLPLSRLLRRRRAGDRAAARASASAPSTSATRD